MFFLARIFYFLIAESHLNFLNNCNTESYRFSYRHILPEKTIVTDKWRAYSIRNIGGGLYEHKVTIQEKNFVDPNNVCVHTQNVENVCEEKTQKTIWYCRRNISFIHIT